MTIALSICLCVLLLLPLLPESKEKMTPEQLQGLRGEIREDDCYQVKQLDFVPEAVVDLGANVGEFSKLARELWPESQIIAIEPNKQNFDKLLKSSSVDRIYNRVIAHKGKQIYRYKDASNGAMECYLGEMLGYEESNLRESHLERVEVNTISLVDLNLDFSKKTLIKIDIEGAENVLFTDQDQLDILLKADYVTMELHYHANDGSQLEAVRNRTNFVMKLFEQTHICRYNHPMFNARKK